VGTTPIADFIQNWLGTSQALVESRNDITVAIRNFFPNLNPFITRFPNVPVQTTQFTMDSHRYRGRSFNLTTAIGSAGTTTIAINDSTSLMNHDVLQLTDPTSGNVEFVWVNSDPNQGGTPTTGTGPYTVTVVRAVGGTSALSSIGTGTGNVLLVTNARTGAEVNQPGLTTVPYLTRQQYTQTFQAPIQVGGAAQATTAQVMPGGMQSPFDFNKTMALQNLCNDIEFACMYGRAQAPNDYSTGTVTAAMCNGVRNILVTNNISGANKPTNYNSYGPDDLIRDTLQAARKGGGDPNLLFVGTDWMGAFAKWGQAVVRTPAGETKFGVRITVLTAPFLDDITLVESPLLLPGTAFCCTDMEIYMRYKRMPFFQPRAILGDRYDGDWIGEGAPEVVNESHHAWVEGVTGFASV
jgi:hypothetical protein